MPTVNANGISIYYERSGTGPPLLFINGSGTTLATTGMLVTPFAERCDVVAYDQRGLGQTEIPPPPYTMAQYAADAAALLDVVGWDRGRVVGISFGGMVAQELAVTWPERVERLALLCTSPGGQTTSSYPLHELDSLPLDERTVKGLELLDTRFTPEWLADHPNDRGLADFLAAGYTSEKSDDQRAGEGAADASTARSRRPGSARAHHLPHLRGLGALRRDRPAHERSGHRRSGARRRDPPLRRRPRVLRPGSRCVSRRSSTSSPGDGRHADRFVRPMANLSHFRSTG